MSELTLCNRCSVAQLIRRFGADRITVTTEGTWTVYSVDGRRAMSCALMPTECACYD